MARADGQMAISRYQALIVTSLAAQVLVDQQVGDMGAVGQIVNDHDPPTILPQLAFPLNIKRVVIDHEPIGCLVAQGRLRLVRVGGGICTQPSGMAHGRWAMPHQRVWLLKQMYLKTTVLNQLREMARMLAGHETAHNSLLAQRLREREAAHDMARANVKRSVGAEDDLHSEMGEIS